MVSVLVIRSKVRGFKPGQGDDGFLKAIKSATRLRSEEKGILQHVKNLLGV
jgi:hypothetical protein